MWIDAIIDPAETRTWLSYGLEMANNNPEHKVYNPGNSGLMRGVFVVLVCIAGQLYAQNTSFHSKRMKAEFVGTIDMAQSTNEATGYMYPTGAPKPGGKSYQHFLANQKKKQNFKKFPTSTYISKTNSTPQPQKGFGTSLYRLTPSGDPYDYTGGIPNDNAMAISKGGMLCAAVNSTFGLWTFIPVNC